MDSLSAQLHLPQLKELIRRFLFDQEHPDLAAAGADVPLNQCPQFSGHIFVYPSAIATFYAPSDLCGIHGMHRERIYAVPSWRHGPPRYDCIFAEKDPSQEGFRGLHVARVFLFFSFKHENTTYPCALVHWFSPISGKPCEDTGMWIVEPDVHDNGTRSMSIIHLDCILRAAHLIGVSGEEFLPIGFKHHDSLDAFQAFYVNKYADHHAHEIVF